MRSSVLVLCLACGCWPMFGGGGGGGGFGIDDAPPPPPGPQPMFGPTVTRAPAPPPISGGTLAIAPGTPYAIAADPDRDRVYVVDMSMKAKVADIALQAGDEPGRVLVDGMGRVHVVLRSGGALVTIDPATWTIAARRTVCPAPRGVAWDGATDLVHVACAGGELVSLPAAGGAATRTVTLDRDLRDVAVFNGQLVVSRFRTAEVLVLDAQGAVASRIAPPPFTDDSGNAFDPDGAWRMLVGPDGALYMLHQRAAHGIVHQTVHGGYGGDGVTHDPIVHTTVTRWAPDFTTPGPQPAMTDLVGPADFVVVDASTMIAVCAGNAKIPELSLYPGYEPIAIAYTGQATGVPNGPVVQSREPAALLIPDPSTGQVATVALSSDSRADTGHAIFHANASSGIACASCHLEGGDDGHTWTFDALGARRTPSLRGNIFGTEPFHWGGEEADFTQLVVDVFQGRMAGPVLASDQLAAAKAWIGALPLLPKAAGDAAAIARGQALFSDLANVGCIGCHAGPHFTNNATLDVGTGASFQVPSLLGVVERAPYLHDGRAATLADRFDPNLGGGDRHGHTSQLSPAQISDLIAFVSSL